MQRHGEWGVPAMDYDATRRASAGLLRRVDAGDPGSAGAGADAELPASPNLELAGLRVLRTASEILSIRTAWDRLQTFHDMDFDLFHAAVSSEAGKMAPYVVAPAGADRPPWLLAGRLCDTPMRWRFGYRTLYGRTVRSLVIPHGGAMGDFTHANAEEIVRALLDALREGHADLLLVRGLNADSPLHRALRGLPGFLYRDRFASVERHWKLELPQSFELFVKTRSKNTKSNIRQYENRLRKEFGDELVARCYRKPDEIETAIADIERIAARTYHRGLGVGFRDDEETRREWRLAAEGGRLRAHVLYARGVPAAFWVGMVYRQTFLVKHTAYDPDLHYYHPGMYLLLRIIEELCASREVAAIDFGFGDADYKRSFGSSCTEEESLCIAAPNLRGASLNLVRTLIVGGDRVARLLGDRLQISGRLKKLWRDRAAGRPS
jgi:Acetyltransferase (GNAT) domain